MGLQPVEQVVEGGAAEAIARLELVLGELVHMVSPPECRLAPVLALRTWASLRGTRQPPEGGGDPTATRRRGCCLLRLA